MCAHKKKTRRMDSESKKKKNERNYSVKRNTKIVTKQTDNKKHMQTNRSF